MGVEDNSRALQVQQLHQPWHLEEPPQPQQPQMVQGLLRQQQQLLQGQLLQQTLPLLGQLPQKPLMQLLKSH